MICYEKEKGMISKMFTCLVFLFFLGCIRIESYEHQCTVRTIAMRTDATTSIFCVMLEVGVGNDVETGQLEYDSLTINVSVKETPTHKDFFMIDSNFCHDDYLSEPVSHDRVSNISFCSTGIAAGHYRTNVHVTGLMIRARHRNGIVLVHDCVNVDNNTYTPVQIRSPVRNTNVCGDIMVCAMNLKCSTGICPYPKCQRSCRSLMYGNGYSAFCDGKLTLHPFSLVMTVDRFTYLPEDNSICYKVSEYNGEKYKERSIGSVEDFTIMLNDSVMLLAGQGIGQNAYNLWSLGKLSPFCDSQTFLNKQFMERDQYVCVDVLPNKTINTDEHSIVYYDTLRYGVTPTRARSVPFERPSLQVNSSITMSRRSGKKRLSQFIEGRGCVTSCSLALTGSGYLACANGTYMYMDDNKIYDVVTHHNGRFDLVPTALDILMTIVNATVDLTANVEKTLKEYCRHDIVANEALNGELDKCSEISRSAHAAAPHNLFPSYGNFSRENGTLAEIIKTSLHIFGSYKEILTDVDRIHRDLFCFILPSYLCNITVLCEDGHASLREYCTMFEPYSGYFSNVTRDVAKIENYMYTLVSCLYVLLRFVFFL